MRFSVAAIAGAFSMALFAPSVLACERECQVNVSRAFADKYEIISNQYFTLLSDKVGESFLYGVPTGILSAPERETAVKKIQDSVAEAQAAWDSTVFQTIFDTIFKDEPKFKGDCNHPQHVKQPPRGVDWVLADCHNQDYICGNPPSICHFMPMIKGRIVNKLRYQLQVRVDGDDSEVYANFIGPALQDLLTTQPKLEPFTATLHGNLNQIMETVKNDLERFASEGQWRKEWDMQIKLLLLTFP